jgi:hypothetical protein
MRPQAAALHDSVAAVNAALEMLDGLGFIKVPALSDELSAVSDRLAAAESDVQELRAAIGDTKAAASANLVAAMTARTIKIDNVLTQIKSTAGKHQAAVAQTQQRMADLSHSVLRAINLLVLLLTALFLVAAAGQILLIYVCWQYVRRGKFPVMRVGRMNLAAP